MLDIGALHRIRSGDIEVVPRIKRFVQQLLLDLISGFKDTILYFSWQRKLLHVVIVHALVILHSQRWS